MEIQASKRTQTRAHRQIYRHVEETHTDIHTHTQTYTGIHPPTYTDTDM